MNSTPIPSLPQEELLRRQNRLYILLDRQAKSYYRSRHLGKSSSLPVELAQELMQSMLYTLETVGGLCCWADPESGLFAGQALLEEKYAHAGRLLMLAENTTDPMHGEGRWYVLHALRKWYTHYDYVHLAHRGPDCPYYPWILPVPPSSQGLDAGIFQINQLCLENQILHAVSSDERAAVLLSLCEEDRSLTENACEIILAHRIRRAHSFLPPDSPKANIENAAQQVAGQLRLTDSSTLALILQVARNLSARENLFHSG